MSCVVATKTVTTLFRAPFRYRIEKEECVNGVLTMEKCTTLFPRTTTLLLVLARFEVDIGVRGLVFVLDNKSLLAHTQRRTYQP